MPENQEPATEQWIFGGTRVGSNDRRWHLWIGPDAEPMHFKAAGSFVVGSIYDVKVTRPDGKVTMHGHPVYTGMQSEDDDLIDSLSAKHRGGRGNNQTAHKGTCGQARRSGRARNCAAV